MSEIKYVHGNLLQAPQRHLIQGCNAKKMGSGVAAAIRSKYPKVWLDYANHADTFGLKLGEIIWSHNDGSCDFERYNAGKLRTV